MQNFKDDHLSIVDLSIDPRMEESLETLILERVKRGECLVPCVVIQLRENRLHVSSFKGMERRMRHFSQIMLLDDICHEV
jgi:hypothetical protein